MRASTLKPSAFKKGLIIAALLLSGAPLAAQGVAVATQAQVNGLDKRVGTLESQMRAVQRQVFPGGDKRFFAPEVAPPETEPATLPGTAASSPLADLSQRVDSLEQQQRSLTGQVEQLQFQLRQLQTEMGKSRGDVEFRLNALEGRNLPAVDGTPTPVPPALAPAPSANRPAPAPSPATPPAVPPPAAGSADSGEAGYLAAYALYAAGDDAGALRAFEQFLKANPKHARASHAHFWSGRALMRQKQPAPAAKQFLDGYKKYPRGERAPNSLVWLGRALIEMKQLPAACQALDELRTAYPDRLNGSLLTESNATRAAAKCAG